MYLILLKVLILIIDRVYLNSWLCKVLRNCYFVIKLIFESPLFKELYFYMFSEGLLFQQMLFCTANFFFNFNFFFYLSFSNEHTNTDIFTLRLPSGAQSGCTTQVIFLLNTILHQIYFLRSALNRNIYQKI